MKRLASNDAVDLLLGYMTVIEDPEIWCEMHNIDMEGMKKYAIAAFCALRDRPPYITDGVIERDDEKMLHGLIGVFMTAYALGLGLCDMSHDEPDDEAKFDSVIKRIMDEHGESLRRLAEDD